MSIDTFIPEVWSARLLDNLEKNLVYSRLLNRDYEGDIRDYGDTVHINTLSDIAVKTYTKNNDIDAPDALTTTEQTLTIKQGNYFNIAIDDVDRVQARGDLMDKAMQNASYQLADKADQYVAGLLKAGTAGTGAEALIGNNSTPIVITKDNAYEILVHLRTILDKSNVQKQGRWVVMPPEFEGFMLLDPRFAYNTGESNTRLANGAVARAAGLDIYISNNVPNESQKKYKVIASYNGAATYAEQILKTEAYRPEKRFGDAVKGLHVYDAKVTRDKAIAVATVNFTAEG